MKKFLLIISFLSVCFSANALTLKSVNIFGEDVNECDVTSSSVDAALAAVMRYSRIDVSPSSPTNLYHQVTLLDVNSGCAASINISIYSLEVSFIPTYQKKVVHHAVLCTKSSLLTGPRYNMQSRVNDFAKRMVESCLMQIDKK